MHKTNLIKLCGMVLNLLQKAEKKLSQLMVNDAQEEEIHRLQFSYAF